MIAANNILNALLMVMSALLAIFLLGMVGLSIPQLFLAVALLSIVVNGYLFTTVPEFIQCFRGWLPGWKRRRTAGAGR